jgi:hypothetical protein
MISQGICCSIVVLWVTVSWTPRIGATTVCSKVAAILCDTRCSSNASFPAIAARVCSIC